MKRVVVTGATGTIGRALIEICIKAGYEVLAVIHRTSNRAASLEMIKNCRVLYLDLSEYDNAIEEMKHLNFDLNNYDFFFHLAWMAPFGEGRNNLDLQLKNVQASIAATRFAKALNCSTFIGAGTQAEYGRVEGKLSAKTPTYPETGYGIAKLCAGHMTRVACEQLGLKHIWTRILSVYGVFGLCDREFSLISTAINCMIRNEDTAFTLCDQMWDYIYSDDAARALLLVAQKGKHGNTYLIGSGEAHPLKDYIRKIAKITNYKKEIGFGKRAYNDKQVMYLQADITELKALGFEKKVSFEEGIKKIIEQVY